VQLNKTIRPMKAIQALLLLTTVGLAQAQGTSTVTRKTSIEYDAYGQVLRETVEPDDAALKLETEYERDPATGVVKSKTLRWQDPASNTAQARVVQRLDYDLYKRFAKTVTNAKGHVETRGYDDAHGNLLSVLDANQLTTGWQYDGWGRKTREERPDGTATTWTLRQCVDSCGSAVSVLITQHWAGASQTHVPGEDFSDALGRVVMSRSWGFDGRAIVQHKAYDDKGRLAAVSRPRFDSAAAVWTYYDRDALGRVWRIRHPNSNGAGEDATTYDYDGLRLTHTNAKQQTRVELRNGLGKLKSVTDANNGTTAYLYDPFGNLSRTTDPKGNQIDIGYDRLGRKTSLNDPDLGAWQYWVDPLGQTWKQQDAKGQVTTYAFDELGRLTQRLERDHDSRWEYDSAAKGVGQLAEAYTWANGSKDVRRVHAYDSAGRLASVTTSLDWDYITEYQYDGFGRQHRQNHVRRARGASSGGAVTSTSTGYNAYGYAERLYREHDGTAVLLWQVLAQDAEGRVTKERLGALSTLRQHNMYTGRLEAVQTGPDSAGSVNPTHQNDVYQYDALGNLTYRAQLQATGGSLLQESFDYDSLNRLTTIGGTLSASYDESGNLKSKRNVGGYSYAPGGAGSIRPHALQDISGTVAGLTNPHFDYDANGNLLSGLNRAYGWTAANLPATIDKLSAGQAVQRTQFNYGPDHERTRQTISPMSAGAPGSASTTIYYAGAIEKEIDTAANVTIIRTQAGVGYIEERIVGTSISPTAAGTRNGRLYLKDHLGSVIGVADEAGNVLQRLSYDAWGRRRNTDGSDDSWASLGTIANNQDNSGYTGHEQLDQLGLVHMNARLYDPITGRHTSADPTVPDPANGQAFNRYSYVLNNALSFTDPTGLAPLDKRPQDTEEGAVRYAAMWQAAILSGKHDLTFFDAIDAVNDAVGGLREFAGEVQARFQAAHISSATDPTSVTSEIVAGLIERWQAAYTGPLFPGTEIAGGDNKYPGPGFRWKMDSEGAKFQPDPTIGESILQNRLLSGGAAEAGTAGRVPRVAAKEAGVVANGIRGRASEARVLQELGLTKNTTAVSTAEGRSIPDALTKSLSVEVKDAANVSLTRQLRIQTEAARAAGRESVLITGENTCVSGACSRAFDTIIRRSDLGPR
jgi:RHS repeat-associated protein